MIDLSLMKGVHVDPKARTARAQGGVTWGEYNRETQVHGLASTGGVVSTTGIAGLTLGGGFGWLHGQARPRDRQPAIGAARAGRRSHRHARARTTNPDLFWAVRGGGGNFGIATSLEYNVHPVGPTIDRRVVAHPFAQARDVLRFFRDITASAPDELTLVLGVLHGPDGSMLSAIVACRLWPAGLRRGSRQTDQDASAPRCSMSIGPMPYCRDQSALRRGLIRKGRSTTGSPASSRR